MKANELMINDWVYHNKVGNTKIISIDNGGIEDWEEKHLIYEYISPIPLAEEILKANGFNYGDYYGLAHKDGFRINKGQDKGFWFKISDKAAFIYYVHELQHALRLCGLNDLADNFKLEIMEE